MSGITTSPESIALSKDLRKRDWNFVGPATMYAFMQAMALVTDNIEGCGVRSRALASDGPAFSKKSLESNKQLKCLSQSASDAPSKG